MEVDTPEMNHKFTRRHSCGSSRASNKSQTSAPTDPGSAFERILNVMKDAGFDSIDTTAAQYYSAKFKPNSTPQLAQSNSRSRDLRRLLQTLQKKAKKCDKHETQAYEEEIVRSAKSICLEELRVLRNQLADCPPRTESASGSSNSSSMTGHNSYGTGTVDELRLQQQKEVPSQPTQQGKRLLRQCLPETWYLLSELAQASQVVYTSLHMTTANTTR